MGGDEDSPSLEPAPAKAKGKQRGKNKGKALANVPPPSRPDADAKPKRRAYTVEQGTAVAQIWKEETCNSIIGRDQSGDKYWGRVADRYNAMFNDDLNTKTVKSFLCRISHWVKE